MGLVDVTKDGRSWRIGTASDVAWLAGQTTHGFSITTAIPPVFDAYATFYPPDAASCVGVDDDRGVGPTAAQGKVVDPEDPWGDLLG